MNGKKVVIREEEGYFLMMFVGIVGEKKREKNMKVIDFLGL